MATAGQSSIRRNIVFSFAGQAILILLSLVATHFVFKRLGAEVLGLISFAVTISQFLVVVTEFGVSTLVTREVAVHRHTDRKYAVDLVTSLSTLAWVAFVVSSVVVWFLAEWMIARWVRLEAIDTRTATFGFQVISISLLLAVPRNIYGAAVAGYERMDLWNVANVATLAIQQIGVAAVIALGGDVGRLIEWYFVSGVTGILIYMYMLARIAGAESLLPIYRAGIVARNIKFGVRLFMSSFVGYVVTQIDRWVISKTLPLSQLGYYGFVQGLVSKGAIVPNAIASAMFPTLSAQLTTAKREVWYAQHKKLQDLCCYLYGPVCAAIAMLGVVVTAVIFNDEVAQLVSTPLIVLSIAQYLFGLLSLSYWLAVAMQRPDISMRANLLGIPIIVPTTIALTYGFGLTGAAISFLIYVLWHYIYFVPRFSRACLGISAGQWFLRIGSFTGGLLLAYAVPWSALYLFEQGHSAIGLATAFVIGTVAFAGIGWLVIGEALRGELKGLFNKILAINSVPRA